MDPQKQVDQRAKQINPNHKPTGPGSTAGYKGTGDKADVDNHGDQRNANNPEFKEKK